MTNQKVRSILAIMVVGGVFLVSSLIILSGMQEGINMVKEFVGVFSGVVGAIIGYYFGQSDSSSNP